MTATYQQRVLEFVEFVNVMRGRYHEATFQEKRNALDVLGVKVRVHPNEKNAPWSPLQTDQEWLSISDVSELTGLHPSTLRSCMQAGRLKFERKGVQHTVIRWDEIQRFFTAERQLARLAQYDDEWFTVYKLTATVGISNYQDIHQAIAAGQLKAEVKDFMHAYIHRDELNRFLRESPIRLRSLFEDATKRIEITYSPLFSGTGVQTSKDAQQVVNVVHNAGLAKLVARLKPVIVVKG